MPRGLSEEKKKKIAKMTEKHSINHVARELDVSRPSVRRYQYYKQSEETEEVEEESNTGKNPDNIIEDYEENVKEEEDSQEEEEELICGNCGCKFYEKKKKCPDCDAKLNYDKTIQV